MVAERRKYNLLKQQQQLKEEDDDRLSHMPDDLLVSILSLLPTRYAARTSLLSYRFQHLWKACSIISFTTRDQCELTLAKFNTKIISMLLTAINNRNPSIPLSVLHLLCGFIDYVDNRHDAIPSLLVKAHSLGLRHLTLYPCLGLELVFPTVFTLSSLESLSILSERVYRTRLKKCFFPVSLPHLRSLSLAFIYIETTELNKLISELSVLENLDLQISGWYQSFGLSSQTIKYLRLEITFEDSLNLNLPALQLLQLESQGGYSYIQHFEIDLPMLKKCVLSLYNLYEGHVSIVTRLLLCLSRIEELHLLLECPIEKMPYHVLLDPNKDVPLFANLKYLEVKTCFHELNCKDIITLVNNSPVLNSLKLIHQVEEFLTKDKKARSCWRSKLPRNHDGNYRYGYFTNLYLENNRKKFFKLFNEKHRTMKLIKSLIRNFLLQ